MLMDVIDLPADDRRIDAFHIEEAAETTCREPRRLSDAHHLSGAHKIPALNVTTRFDEEVPPNPESVRVNGAVAHHYLISRPRDGRR